MIYIKVYIRINHALKGGCSLKGFLYGQREATSRITEEKTICKLAPQFLRYLQKTFSKGTAASYFSLLNENLCCQKLLILKTSCLLKYEFSPQPPALSPLPPPSGVGPRSASPAWLQPAGQPPSIIPSLCAAAATLPKLVLNQSFWKQQLLRTKSIWQQRFVQNNEKQETAVSLLKVFCKYFRNQGTNLQTVFSSVILEVATL